VVEIVAMVLFGMNEKKRELSPGMNLRSEDAITHRQDVKAVVVSIKCMLERSACFANIRIF